jgi:hypothetical protein
MTDKGLTPSEVKTGKKFALMAIVKGKDEDDMYRKMQGDFMSPVFFKKMIDKCQSLLEQGRIPHTSMSAGDVLYNKDKNEWLQCDQIGWKKFGGRK